MTSGNQLRVRNNRGGFRTTNDIPRERRRDVSRSVDSSELIIVDFGQIDRIDRPVGRVSITRTKDTTQQDIGQICGPPAELRVNQPACGIDRTSVPETNPLDIIKNERAEVIAESIALANQDVSARPSYVLVQEIDDTDIPERVGIFFRTERQFVDDRCFAVFDARFRSPVNSLDVRRRSRQEESFTYDSVIGEQRRCQRDVGIGQVERTTISTDVNVVGQLGDQILVLQDLILRLDRGNR